LEKFGMPTVVGKYPPGTDPAQQAALLDAIDAIQHDTGIKVPDTMALELLEASRTGNAGYQGLCDYFDRQISKAVLGQTLTTEVAGEGSYAASQTHNDVRQELVTADADMLCEVLNATLVRWIVDLNFGPQAAYPTLWLRTDPAEDLGALAARDKVLAVDIGVPIDDGYWYETYDIPKPEGEPAVGRKEQKTDPAKAPPSASDEAGNIKAFAKSDGRKTALDGFGAGPVFTPEQQAIEGLKAALQAKGHEASEALLAPIAEAVRSSGDFDEAKAKIMAAYGDMDDAALTELLAQALFAADVWGRLNGDADGR
jgi:phage gp29-like protein